MSDLTAAGLLSGLLRTTIVLSATALVVWCLLRLARSSSPAIHRGAWMVVLLQGWLFIRWGLNVPWYEPPSRLPRPEAWDFAVAASVPPGVQFESGPSDQPRAPRPELAVGWDWQRIAVAGWLLGMIVAVGRWVANYSRFVRGLPLGEPADAADVATWQQLLGQRHICREIPLRVADGLGPALCRLPGGYRLLLPRAAWQELPAEARMSVLLHELAHYERGDVWKSLVARLLALPHWFNPFAWWAVWNFDDGAEWACDEAVRRAVPENTPAYGRALLLLGAGQAAHGMLNSAAQGRGLALRIQRLLTTNLRRESVMKKTLVIVIVLALLLAGGLRVRLVARAAAEEQAQRAAAAEEQAKRTFGSSAAKAHAEQARAMLDTAKKTYEVTRTAYDDGTEVFSNLYVWSVRWLEVERALAETKDADLAALRGHWERTKDWYNDVEPLYRNGARGGEPSKFRAAEYYVAEAAFWLVAAGGTVPMN